MAHAYGTNSTLRKERKQQTRDKLMQAAVEVFREKGFASGKIDDIAARAQVSRQAFYLHFESREQLLLEIMRLEEGRMILQYKRLAQMVSPTPQSCSRWAEEFLGLAHEDRTTILLLMRTVPFEIGQGGNAIRFYDDVIAMMATHRPAFAAATRHGDPVLHARALLLFFQLETMLRYVLLETILDGGSLCLAWGEQWADFAGHRLT